MRRHMDWGSLRIVGAVVLGGLILIGGTAEAGDPLEVELACSTSIPATGGPLSITLTMRNKTSAPKAIATSALVVHVGNLNLLGPFLVPFSANLAPFATQVLPYLSSPFPAGSASPGTFITVSVIVMDSANKPLGSNFCLIRIQ